jgi:hypothetical protein
MTTTDVRTVTSEDIGESYTYREYRNDIEHRLKAGKSTGENHSEEMLHYSKMNLFRMKRLERYTTLIPELKRRLSNIERPMIWLVLTEGWCGDAAQSLPVIDKMAKESDRIVLKLLLRDQNPELMEQFLTNGTSRSIPRLIVLDRDTLEVLESWGPRPEPAQQLFYQLRDDVSVDEREAAERLHKWYADDRTRVIQEEILSLIERCDA